MIELASFEALKDILDLDKESINDYPALGIIQLGVLFAIEEELGRELESTERTETTAVGLQSTNHLYLKAVPISSVSSVTVDGDALTSDEYTIMAGGLRLDSAVSESSVVVTYTGGYTVTEIPQTLKRAAEYQTAYEYQGKENIGASSVTTDGGSVNTPALQLLPMTKRLLSKNKHPWLGVYGI